MEKRKADELVAVAAGEKRIRGHGEEAGSSWLLDLLFGDESGTWSTLARYEGADDQATMAGHVKAAGLRATMVANPRDGLCVYTHSDKAANVAGEGAYIFLLLILPASAPSLRTPCVLISAHLCLFGGRFDTYAQRGRRWSKWFGPCWACTPKSCASKKTTKKCAAGTPLFSCFHSCFHSIIPFCPSCIHRKLSYLFFVPCFLSILEWHFLV
jgi:hypothetical protein